MANFWRVVNDVIDKSDIIMIVADARLPQSVNDELLNKIQKSKKKYIVVFNKEDLAPDLKQLKAEIKKYEYALSISSLKHQKTMVLLRKLNAIAGGKVATVGVVG